MKTTTLTTKSQQIAVRIPLDVLHWLGDRAGPCRGVATVINEILRKAYDSAEDPKPHITRRKKGA